MSIQKTLLLVAMLACGSTSALAQPTKEDALLQAEIEKAKAEAAESKARAIKAELEIQQAGEKAKLALQTAQNQADEAKAKAKKAELDNQQSEDKAKLELQTAQDQADESRRTALKDASKSLSDLALKGEIKDVTVSGSQIESSTLTYRALSPVVKQIVAELSPQLCLLRAESVVLTDDQAIGALPAFEATLASAQTVATQYQSIIDQVRQTFQGLKTSYSTSQRFAMASLPLVMEGVVALASLAQTFKTQFSVTSTSVTVDTLALQGVLAKEWVINCPSTKSEGANVSSASNRMNPQPILTAYPNLNQNYASTKIGVAVTSLNTSQSQGLQLETEITVWLKQAKASIAQKPAADVDAAKPPVAAKVPTISAPKNQPDEPADSAKKAEDVAAAAKKQVIEDVEMVLEKLKSANQRADQVLLGFIATTEKQPISPLIQLIKSERLATMLNKPSTYALNLRAVAAGGNTVATNNFWTGPKLFHSGGAVLAYTLIASDGHFVGGGVLDSHTGYVRLKIQDASTLGNSWGLP